MDGSETKIAGLAGEGHVSAVVAFVAFAGLTRSRSIVVSRDCDRMGSALAQRAGAAHHGTSTGRKRFFGERRAEKLAALVERNGRAVDYGCRAAIANRGRQLDHVSLTHAGAFAASLRCDVTGCGWADLALDVHAEVIESCDVPVAGPLAGFRDDAFVVHAGDRVGVLTPQRSRGHPAVRSITKDANAGSLAGEGRLAGVGGAGHASGGSPTDEASTDALSIAFGITGAAAVTLIASNRVGTVGVGGAAQSLEVRIDGRARNRAVFVRGNDQLAAKVSDDVSDDWILVPGTRGVDGGLI